jgi:hypothetical protein
LCIDNYERNQLVGCSTAIAQASFGAELLMTDGDRADVLTSISASEFLLLSASLVSLKAQVIYLHISV